MSEILCEDSFQRDIIVHAHIFKNAGTTLDWVLNNNFGPSFKDDRNDFQMRTDSTYLPNLVRADTNLKAVSSHSVRLPIRNQPDIKFHTLLMIRNPLERIRSVYDFERLQVAKTPGAIKAKECCFKEYVLWRMQKDVAPTIRNMQVRYLSQNSQKQNGNVCELHLNSSLEYVKSNPFVGVVEMFDLSLKIWADSFQKIDMPLDFTYKKQNVSKSSRSKVIDKENLLKEDLGEELFELVVDENKFDIELHKKTQEIILERHSDLCRNNQPRGLLARFKEKVFG